MSGLTGWDFLGIIAIIAVIIALIQNNSFILFMAFVAIIWAIVGYVGASKPNVSLIQNGCTVIVLFGVVSELLKAIYKR